MRLMEQTGAIAHAALRKIFRQQIAALRDAVYDLSAGKTESGFSKLDAFGAIPRSKDNADRLEAIANQHIAAVREGKSSLIVAPTHAECRAISEVVRDRQKMEGFLSGEEHAIRRLVKVNLTESQRPPGPFIWTRVLRSRATRHRAKLLTRSSSACPWPRLANKRSAVLCVDVAGTPCDASLYRLKSSAKRGRDASGERPSLELFEGIKSETGFRR